MPGGLAATLRGLCPRCGRGPLFSGWLKLAPACSDCGLDLSRFDQGDGPAVFVILIAGFVVVGAALWVEVSYSPPYWVHAALFVPLTLALTLGLLRPLKAWMVERQFTNDAGEGRLDR